MARYVIDAPTLLQLVADDAQVHPSHQLVAPNAIRTEALARLLAAVRRGDVTEHAALAQHERMTTLKIRLLGDRVSRRTAWKVAMRQNWEDLLVAEYVAVCMLQADALVTVDAMMANRATGLVPLAPYSALSAGA